MQRADKLRTVLSVSFLCAAVGTRMGQLCGRCMQLLRDFVAFVQRMSSDLVRGIKECLTLISQCSCLKHNSSKTRQLYKPILQPHERVTAQEFLQQIETGKRACLFSQGLWKNKEVDFVDWKQIAGWTALAWHGAAWWWCRKGQSYRAFSLCTGSQGLKWY